MGFIQKANPVDGGNAFPTDTSHTVSDLEEGTAYKGAGARLATTRAAKSRRADPGRWPQR